MKCRASRGGWGEGSEFGRYVNFPGYLAYSLAEGYDLVLLVHFPHLDRAACERLLTKVHAALIPGGRAIVLGLVPNEDRVSPPTAAARLTEPCGGMPGAA
jgi:hypothetical protein